MRECKFIADRTKDMKVCFGGGKGDDYMQCHKIINVSFYSTNDEVVKTLSKYNINLDVRILKTLLGAPRWEKQCVK